MKIYSDIVADYISENARLKTKNADKILHLEHGLDIESYTIKNGYQSRKYNKPVGKYTLLTLSHFLSPSKNDLKYYLTKLTDTLLSYMPRITNTTTILVIGLGNRHLSADALGTEVVKNVFVTRNLQNNTPQLCAFAPSVMGLTGIETADTVDALVSKIKPDITIIVDSLCASNVSRLGVSFQVSNVPITPGSGINNTRKKIKNLGTVISIGVPLVVYADTIVDDAITSLEKTNSLSLSKDNNHLYLKHANTCFKKDPSEGLSPTASLRMTSSSHSEPASSGNPMKNPIRHSEPASSGNPVKNLSRYSDLLVTIKDIDYVVKDMGQFIAKAINNAVFK